MENNNFNELKETIKEFDGALKEMVKSDEEYQGEADGLLVTIDRVQKKMETINTYEEFKKEMGPFGIDMLEVMSAIQELTGFDEDDIDFDFESEELVVDVEKE